MILTTVRMAWATMRSYGQLQRRLGVARTASKDVIHTSAVLESSLGRLDGHPRRKTGAVRIALLDALFQRADRSSTVAMVTLMAFGKATAIPSGAIRGLRPRSIFVVNINIEVVLFMIARLGI